VSSSALTKKELPKPQWDPPRELSVAEIREIINKFASAAARAQQAGVDGLELNGATAHLLNAFLSRAWNKRQDAYGSGSHENRARLMAEIIREVKKRNGKDWPIIALFNGTEFGLEKVARSRAARRAQREALEAES
jgi:2,4-dienoyl-CoA reductase (NADPH2)